MNIRITQNWIVGLLIGSALLMSGCDAFLDEKPTCEEKLTAFYELDCAMYYNGTYMYLYEAIDYCEEGLVETAATKCEEHLYDWMKCSDKLTPDNCAGCDYHFELMFDCIDTYYQNQSSTYGK